MQIALGLITALPLAFVVLLALLCAGIRRQERAASLTCQPRSLSAALARRVLGLHVYRPIGLGGSCPADDQTVPTLNGKEARSS